MEEPISEKARQALVNQMWRVANLTERLLLGPLTPQVRTPWRTVHMWEQCTLYQYIPVRKTVGPPLLIIPPLMVRPTIYDLRAGHSMVGYFMEQGIDVYLLDLGVPDSSYKEIGLEDYIMDFVRPAFDKVLEISGSDSLFQFGWSMGGIMSYIFTALQEDQSKLAGLITAGAPVKFSEMFPFHFLAKVFNLPLDTFVALVGNIPPFLIRLSFRLVSPLASVMRYGELAANYHDREWVAAYESIDNWVDGFVPYAQETFKQFVNECIIDDKLRMKKLSIRGKVVDLYNIACPLLVMAAETDKLAPIPAVEPIIDYVSSSDITIHKAPMGHIGMMAGRRAPEHIWKPMADWIVSHR